MNESEDQRAATSNTDGRIIQFLRRNYFLVQLRDRQVVAAMPEALLPLGAQFKGLAPGESIHVTVRLRKRPRMARIIAARRTSLCG
jgi:hypothetical protein